MGAPDINLHISERPSKSGNGENWQKMGNIHIFFKFIIFSQNRQIYSTYAYNSMDYGLSQGNMNEMGQFKKIFILAYDRLQVGFNLICIFKFRCPVKKSHGSAQSETCLKLMFSVWGSQ